MELSDCIPKFNDAYSAGTLVCAYLTGEVRNRLLSGKRAWKATLDRLRRAYYLSGVDHVRKIRDRKQRTDIGK